MKTTYLFLFLLTSCLLNAQSLKGTAWVLASIDNLEAGKSNVTGNDTKLSLQFDSDSTYSGTGCNKYTGAYKTVDNKTLSMSAAKAATKLETCLGLAALEKELFAYYTKAVRYRMSDDKLFIFTSDDYRLCFKKQ